jgi:hypothetical protein
MSTLVPGSEPWQIAEPLEYAADIWKALEEKYGPKSGERCGDENDGIGEVNSGQTTARGWQDKATGDQPATTKDGLAQEVSGGLQEVAQLWTQEQERDVASSAVKTAEVAEEKRRWNTDSMRDQRFLWALLNGGKEEEITRVNGGKDCALGTAG